MFAGGRCKREGLCDVFKHGGVKEQRG